MKFDVLSKQLYLPEQWKNVLLLLALCLLRPLKNSLLAFVHNPKMNCSAPLLNLTSNLCWNCCYDLPTANKLCCQKFLQRKCHKMKNYWKMLCIWFGCKWNWHIYNHNNSDDGKTSMSNFRFWVDNLQYLECDKNPKCSARWIFINPTVLPLLISDKCSRESELWFSIVFIWFAINFSIAVATKLIKPNPNSDQMGKNQKKCS